MSGARARIILGCLALALAAVAWFGFAPAALGGGTTYATVAGTSMEPSLRHGDLVLLRSGPPYRIGDVVGYRDATLRRLVLHRIVAGGPAGYTTKGDNNDFRDPSHPREADIVGRRWVRIPHAGAIVGPARAPGSAALLVAGLVLLPTGGRRRRSGRARRERPTPPSQGSADIRRPTTFALLAAALALAGLGAFAYARPAMTSAVQEDAYRQTGTFDYRATATPGAAYPGGVVGTGEAVFVRLTRAVAVTFAYRLTSEAPADLRGSATLDAVVSDGLGWSRTLTLGAPRVFRGAQTSISGTISLDRVRAITAAFERETGATPTDYSLTLTPRIAVAGAVGGSPLRERFAPTLPFRLDPVRLAVGPAPDGGPSSLRSVRTGALTREGATTIAFPGHPWPVARVRSVGVLGAEVALGLAILIGLPLYRVSRRSEAAAIRARLGGRLLDVARLPQAGPEGCVDVARIADLVRLADRAERPIMVEERGDRARYAVVSDGLLYLYSIAEPARVGESLGAPA